MRTTTRSTARTLLLAAALLAADLAVDSGIGHAGLIVLPTVAAGTVTTVHPGAPAGAVAAMVNITATDGAAAGYVTADRCSALVAGPQAFSNGNHLAKSAAANLAVVPLDGDGSFCLYNQSLVNLAVDTQGSFAPPDVGGLTFVPVSGAPVLDTRGAGSNPVLAAGVISTVHTGAPAGTTAVLANITMTAGTAPGYITAGPCSTLVAGPQTRSNGNHLTGTAIANLSVIPVDPDGDFCLYNQSPVHLIVDVQGDFVDDGGGAGFAPSAPERALDTRGAGTNPVRPAGSLTTVHSGAPAGTTAVLANITMTAGTAPGYITAGPCSTLVAGPQTRSNGNHLTGTAIANLSVIPVDPDGDFCLYNQSPVHLIVDVQGRFGGTATNQFFLATPQRVLDTRPAPIEGPPVTSCTSVVHIGDSTSVGLIAPAILPNPADRVDAQYRRVGVLEPHMEISGARSIVERLSGQLNAFEVASNWKSRGYQGCWVLALGTTDTANVGAGSSVSRRSRIDAMMALIGDDPVMWVNVKTRVTDGPWSNANMQLWNAELAAAAIRYPNLHVYDWSAVVQNVWFSGDQIHYTPDGYRQRARLIADALAVSWPG